MNTQKMLDNMLANQYSGWELVSDFEGSNARAVQFSSGRVALLMGTGIQGTADNR